MYRYNLIVMLLLVLFASACGSTAVATDISADEPPASTVHELMITANGQGWEAPDSVPAGWTRITLDNQSEAMRQTAFLRLDDDKTMDDVFAAIEAGMEGTPPWMTAYGGVSGVMPGERKAVSVNLPAGHYIVIDPVPEVDGIPGMAKGYFMPLLVEESNVATAPPSSDMSLELVDYAFNFDFDAVTAGSHVIQVSNSSTQEAHEAVIVKLNEGTTVEDFLAAMAPDAPAGPPPGEFIVGTAAFEAITENYLEVEFEAGATYALICFIPSPLHGGQPHFMLNMVGQFVVPN